MILLYPNIICVYQDGNLIYKGTDYKAAQQATIPF